MHGFEQFISFLDLSAQNELWILGPDATVIQVLTTLSQPKVKRVPILTKRHQIKRFVTQSEMLDLILSHIDEFGPIVDCSIEDLGLGYYRPYDECVFFFSRNVILILPTISIILFRLGVFVDKAAFDAFFALIERHTPAIPVISDSGRVCGAVAVRDVRHVTGNHTARELAKPLSQFIEEQSLHSAEQRVRHLFFTILQDYHF